LYFVHEEVEGNLLLRFRAASGNARRDLVE
jgi:hypothetical protein